MSPILKIIRHDWIPGATPSRAHRLAPGIHGLSTAMRCIFSKNYFLTVPNKTRILSVERNEEVEWAMSKEDSQNIILKPGDGDESIV